MGCLVPSVRTVSPTISASAESVGGLTVSADSIGGLNVSIGDIGGLDVSVRPSSDMNLTASATCVNYGLSVSVILSCAVNISAPYLEISPSLLWIFDNTADNDVYSNVHWFVD